MITDALTSLQSLVGAILKRSLMKDDLIRLSRWSSASLSAEQKAYAALDAYVGLHLWTVLASKESVGQPLPEEVQAGQHVTLYSGKTPVAEGRISALQEPMLVDPVGSERRDGELEDASGKGKGKAGVLLKLTRARIIVIVEKVLVPGYIVPLHHTTLSELSEKSLTPFNIMVHRRLLRTCGTDSPINVPSDSTSHLPPSHPDDFSSDNLRDEDIDFILASGLLSLEDDLDEDEDTAHPEVHTSAGKSSAELPSMSTSPGSPTSNPPATETGSQSDTTDPEIKRCVELLTRILGDIFHVEDHLLHLLSKKHSAFEEFARQFSRALWMLHKDDVAAVRAVYERKGMSFSYALRAYPDKLRRCIRHAVPQPDVLVPRLCELFESWSDVICSVDARRGKFFSDAARQQADAIIRVAQLGLLSDPPGVQLYYLMGKDSDGLNIYRTTRGTSGIEGGLHTSIRRTFGSLQASPELTDALLRNIRHRRNTSVSFYQSTIIFH
jgi:hypothetical protein